MKDYLGFENARNKSNAECYTRLITMALQDQHKDVAVLIGHHLTFELGGDLQTENEVPSADCLMFDHELMTAVFGQAAIPIMQRLAGVECGKRDEMLHRLVDIAWKARLNVGSVRFQE